MPRYYFEVRNERVVYEDADGEDYPSDEAALEAGQRLADEFASELDDFYGSTLAVLNEDGDEIGILAIRPPNEQLQ